MKVKGVNPCSEWAETWPGTQKAVINVACIIVTYTQVGAGSCASGLGAWAPVYKGFGGLHLLKSGNNSPPTLPIFSLKGDTQTTV